MNSPKEWLECKIITVITIISSKCQTQLALEEVKWQCNLMMTISKIKIHSNQTISSLLEEV
jgi:hypothetical protein